MDGRVDKVGLSDGRATGVDGDGDLLAATVADGGRRRLAFKRTLA